jgi:hypothetical protein
VLAGRVTQRLAPAGLGQQQVDGVGHGRLRQDQRHVGGFQRCPQRARVVELGDPHPSGDALGQAALHRGDLAAVQVHQALLEVAVVVPLEQHDHLAPGDRPRQPDRLGVGLGGRQREPPQRDGIARASTSATATDASVDSRNCVDRATCACTAATIAGWGVAAEYRHVRGVEVQVGKPVGISETRAAAMVDVDRLIVVRGHPRHRGCRCACAHAPADHGQRPRPGLPEPRQLPGMQPSDPSPVEITQCSHPRMLERPAHRSSHLVSVTGTGTRRHSAKMTPSHPAPNGGERILPEGRRASTSRHRGIRVGVWDRPSRRALHCR